MDSIILKSIYGHFMCNVIVNDYKLYRREMSPLMIEKLKTDGISGLAEWSATHEGIEHLKKLIN